EVFELNPTMKMSAFAKKKHVHRSTVGKAIKKAGGKSLRRFRGHSCQSSINKSVRSI
ncbi:Uncharacterized protein FKW44_012821, partial [Caligus rogercresseyi]